MRAHRDPFGPTPDEAMADTLDAFELVEVGACVTLRRLSLATRAMPPHLRAGLAAGRLELRPHPKPGGGTYLVPHRVYRRLSFSTVRHGGGTRLMTLRHPEHGTVRLPYA